MKTIGSILALLTLSFSISALAASPEPMEIHNPFASNLMKALAGAGAVETKIQGNDDLTVQNLTCSMFWGAEMRLPNCGFTQTVSPSELSEVVTSQRRSIRGPAALAVINALEAVEVKGNPVMRVQSINCVHESDAPEETDTTCTLQQ